MNSRDDTILRRSGNMSTKSGCQNEQLFTYSKTSVFDLRTFDEITLQTFESRINKFGQRKVNNEDKNDE